ncbi:hypothetical protein [Treponema succinifaciens]|uniref:hypothetical protein n=1 Tax=Treponema succinifaciens TaxID=167 RepID=UPI0023F254EB|nr:hypothetical protein [Treponema succinifaciens]
MSAKNLRTGLFRATASASDQTQAFVFAYFFKIRSPFQSLTQEIPTPSAAFLPSVSAKRQSEIPSKTKAKSSKKRTAFSISTPACIYNSIFKTTFRQSIRISCALKDIFSGFAARIIFAAAART